MENYKEYTYMTKKEEIEEQLKEEAKENLLKAHELFNLPQGLYHRISLTGNSYTVDICVPAYAVEFSELVHFTQWLSLFASDESIKNLTKENIKKFLKQDSLNTDDEEDPDV